MEKLRRYASLITVLLFLVFQSCEKPQSSAETSSPGEEPVLPVLNAVPEPLTAPASPVAEKSESVDPAPANVTSKAADQAPQDAPVEEKEPDLSVTMKEGKILISGAMRSRLQVERIVETLTREFPDLTVESDLKVDTDRIPVGWGNRIADGLLVPYFQRIKNPGISYHDTVVKLEGTASSLPELRMVSEVTVEMFSGGNTSNIDNQLSVEPRTNP